MIVVSWGGTSLLIGTGFLLFWLTVKIVKQFPEANKEYAQDAEYVCWRGFQVFMFLGLALVIISIAEAVHAV